MLRNNYIAITDLWLKTLIDLNAPTAFCECCAQGLALLELGGVLPTDEEAGFELLVEAIVDGDMVGLARRLRALSGA